MNNIHYFYKITNLINNHFYYGVHNTNNLNDGYMGSGVILLKAYKKYGIENFKKEILEYFDTQDQAFDYEKEFITEDLVNDPNCYNVKTGGSGWQNQYIKKNKVVVTDGEYNFLVDKDDPRYKSGELVSIIKNKVFVTNILTNENLWCDITDPKYKSGEYISYFKNKKITDIHKLHLSEALKEYNRKNKNSIHMYGKCWIYKLDPILENKVILKSELQNYLNNGWIKGRKMLVYHKGHHKSCNKGEDNPNYGKCYIYRQLPDKTYESIRITKSLILNYLDNGWIKGRKINKVNRDYYKGKNYPTYDELIKEYNLLKSWEKVALKFNITRKIIYVIRKNYNKNNK